MTRSTQALVALLVFVALGLATLHRTVLGGHVLSTAGHLASWGPFADPDVGLQPNTLGLGDQFRAFEPWLRYAADHHADDGELPFWKDASFCGAPLLGNGQSALFFPPTFLAIVLGAPWWYQGALGFFKLVAGAFFTYLLARHAKISFVGGLIAGVTFSFFGFQIAWLTFPLTNVSTFLPLLILLADRALLRPSGGRLTSLAVVSALQHFGGHPETTFKCHAVVYLIVLVRAYALRGRPGARLGKRLLLVTGAFVLGATLATVQILPLLEYLRVSDALRHREALSPLQAIFDNPWSSAGFGLASIVTFVAAQRVARTPRWPGPWSLVLFVSIGVGLVLGLEARLSTNFVSSFFADWIGGRTQQRAEASYLRATSFYTGPGLALALLGQLYGRPRRLAKLAGVVMWITLLIGLRAPIFRQVIDSLPVFSVTANERFVLFSNLATAILAGLGLDALGRVAASGIVRRRYAYVGLAVTFAVVGASTLGALRGPIGIRSAPAAGGGARSLQHARVEAVSRAGPGVVEVSGPFTARERVESCRIVAHGNVAESAELELLGESERGFEYSFSAVLPRLTSPRSPLRLIASAGKVAYQSNAVSGPVDRRATWSSRPVAPVDGHAIKQVTLYAAVFALALALLGASGAALLVGRLALASLVAVSVYWFAHGFNPALPRQSHYPPSPALSLLASSAPDGRTLVVKPTMLHGTLSYYGIPQVLGYDGVTPADVAHLARIALDKPARRTAVQLLPARRAMDMRLLGMMAVRYVMTVDDPSAVLGLDALEEVPYPGHEDIARYTVAENREFLPRARLVARSAVEGSEEALWTRLASPEFDPRSLVLLDSGRELESSEMDVGSATITSSIPDAVSIAIEPAAPCHLVLADTHFPGWNAYVDGEPREISAANGAFRAVYVEPGERVVEFRYEPRSFGFGLLATIAATFLALMGVFLPRSWTPGPVEP